MKKYLLSIPIFLFLASLSAQETQRCHTTEYTQLQYEADPQLKTVHAEIEKAIEEWLENNGNLTDLPDAQISIPVVVHVVWKTQAQNISDAQIVSQINKLNKDFQRQNADTTKTPAHFKPIAANTEISFCLAQRDPNGGWTNGIVRRETTVNSFSMNDAVKYTNNGGSNAWDRTKYLNIWVCNLSGGILGYAQFPGGAAATDGVVIGYQYFGDKDAGSFNLSYPYNEGRTATHEIGHWINLRHIWGDANCGTDLVNDTPTQQTSTYGCPSGIQVSCNNGPNGNNYQNYMDYSDDRCMNMFTAGQKARMWASINTTRSSLKTSNGCLSTAIARFSLDTHFYVWPNPANNYLQLHLNLPESQTIYLRMVNMLGAEVYAQEISDVLTLNKQLGIEHLEQGVYFLQLKAGDKTAVKKVVITR